MISTGVSLLENHLWQSTLCVGAAWLLTLALRKNRAAVRYWVWLAASVKFLIPFSLLVSIGGRLGWRTVAASAQPQWSTVIDDLGRPFAATAPTSAVPAGVTAAASHSIPSVPAVLFAIWVCGFAVCVTRWIRDWRRTRAVQRRGTPLALRLPIPAVSSATLLEPGVFGIFRPVLLLPEGITERLTARQFDAIVAHEMCHVRRRDNFAAAIHMLVEAIFWFHPLVWWMSARLVEERERACDEEVLQSGSEREVYAEGILSVCKFYTESPLACASGISGADLKSRIIRIMTEHASDRLSAGRKLLLGLVAAAAIAGPVAFGVANAPAARAESQSAATGTATARPSFEVASIKPNRSGDNRFFVGMRPGRFTASANTRMIIEFAYGIQSDKQLLGAPSWVNSDPYDIEGKIDDSQYQKIGKLPPEERDGPVMSMVQSLLADRFDLKVSRETRELPVYALVLAKGGPKLTAASGPGAKGFRGSMMRTGKITFTDAGVSLLADVLSREPELGGRVVLDETGLMGKYNFALQWTPERGSPMLTEMRGSPPPGDGPNDAPPPDATGPSIFTAIQEQLGLKLEPRKGPVQVLVIDHIDKPSAN